MEKGYKVRRFQNGKNKDGEPFINYSLTIPSHIAERLPNDIRFACELTEDGLLFRPVSGSEEQITLPAWAKTANGSAPKAAPRRSRPKKKEPEQA